MKKKTKKLKFINSPKNIFFIARYYACAMASTDTCFFQDDDWLVWPMNSLYQNYLNYPNLLHTNTNPVVNFLSWSWTFYDESINLHSGK